MEYFEFEKKENVTDERAVFANKICKLIYDKNNESVDKSVDDISEFADHMENLIRNVYELELNQIPLVGLHRLRAYGADNFDFSPEEYQQAEANCIRAIVNYYTD